MKCRHIIDGTYTSRHRQAKAFASATEYQAPESVTPLGSVVAFFSYGIYRDYKLLYSIVYNKEVYTVALKRLRYPGAMLP